MIRDCDTNFLYLADGLQKGKYRSFLPTFEQALSDLGIPYQFLKGTRDIWAVDYMPVQISKDEYVQFVYRPDYLLKTKAGVASISDTDRLCRELSVIPVKCPILVDGGNVVRWDDKVIMTKKAFAENPTISEARLVKLLRDALQVDKIIFIPADPSDFTGHADGMVRFLDSDTVLINNYKEESGLKEELESCLKGAGLNCIEIPYNPYGNKGCISAIGIYINYLQMEQAIVLPVYGMKDDEVAVKQFEQLFSGIRIATVDSNAIAREGGVLNCVTWNVLKQRPISQFPLADKLSRILPIQ